MKTLIMIEISFITNPKIVRPFLEIFVQNKPNYYYNDLNNQIVRNISEETKKYLTQQITTATKYMEKYLSPYFMDTNLLNDWNICLTQNNFMFGNPMTLDKIVFMPLDYVLSASKQNCIKTLIHEKLHIFQRYNLKKWKQYISENTNFKISKNIFIDGEIYNPDTFYNFSYVYLLDGVKYKGFLNDNLKTRWICQGKIVKNDKLPKYEHPFEMLAYVISNNIIKKSKSIV